MLPPVCAGSRHIHRTWNVLEAMEVSIDILILSSGILLAAFNDILKEYFRCHKHGCIISCVRPNSPVHLLPVTQMAKARALVRLEFVVIVI